MEKDKWSQKVIAFQLTIGVQEKDLGQVGLSGDRVLVITVPNYQISYSFFSHLVMCMSIFLCICFSVYLRRQNRTKTRTGWEKTKQRKEKNRWWRRDRKLPKVYIRGKRFSSLIHSWHPFPKLGPNPHAGVLHRLSYLLMTLDEAFTKRQNSSPPSTTIYSKENKCPVSDKFLSLENIFILHLSAKIR